MTMNSADPPRLIIGSCILVCFFFVLPCIIYIWILIHPSFRKQTKDQNETESWAFSRRQNPIESRSLSEEKCCLTFENVGFSIKETMSILEEAPLELQDTKPVKMKRKKVSVDTVILQGISGFAKPGTLTAIMGPGGCGKTTLMDMLCKRHSSPHVSGSILINGQSLSTNEMKRISAYVLQSDILLSNLTVRETLLYTVQLRLPDSVSTQEKQSRVEQVMKELELSHVADTIVGSEDAHSRGLSGGQKRRLSIAIELVTRPSILFLDEPTTGLASGFDAYTSLKLIQTLRKLADSKQCTILCTINQPRSDIFEQNGGLAYFGPIASIQSYFQQQHVSIPEHSNVADFIVDLTCHKEDALPSTGLDPLMRHSWNNNFYETNSEYGSQTHLPDPIHPSPLHHYPSDVTLEETDDQDDLIFKYKKSSLCKEMNHLLGEVVRTYSKPDMVYKTPLGYPNSLSHQITILVRRASTNMWRGRSSFYSSFGLMGANLLFFGLLYLGLKTSDSYSSSLSFMQSQKAFLFQVVTGVCLLELDVLARAFLEKTIFFREHAAGTYSAVSYHIAWFLQLVFFGLLKGLVYPPFCYFLSGLTLSLDRYIYFSLVIVLMSATGSSIAFVLISAISALEGAASAYSAIIGTMATFCGFFFLPKLIPPWFIYSYYMSFYKYALEGLYWNEFHGRDLKLVVNSTISANTTVVTKNVLEVVQVDVNFNRWSNLMMLMVYPILFHLLAYLATYLRVQPITWSFRSKPSLPSFPISRFSKQSSKVFPEPLEPPTHLETHSSKATLVESTTDLMLTPIENDEVHEDELSSQVSSVPTTRRHSPLPPPAAAPLDPIAEARRKKLETYQAIYGQKLPRPRPRIRQVEAQAKVQGKPPSQQRLEARFPRTVGGQTSLDPVPDRGHVSRQPSYGFQRPHVLQNTRSINTSLSSMNSTSTRRREGSYSYYYHPDMQGSHGIETLRARVGSSASNLLNLFGSSRGI